jgi:hypothetical protein
MFSAFYRRLPRATVQTSGAEGFAQVALLIDIIRDQGEGAKSATPINEAFQNTADDSEQEVNHYDKFCQIRHERLPATYPVKDPAEYTDEDSKRLAILVANFASFMSMLGDLFAGKNPANFAPLMVTIGGNILACWKSGVTPRFT